MVQLQHGMEAHPYERAIYKKEYLKTLVRDWLPNKVRLWDLVQAVLVKPKYLLNGIQSNLWISLYTWQEIRNNPLRWSVGMWSLWQISSCDFDHFLATGSHWPLIHLAALHWTSLVPRPHPAFCHLQYGKVGEGLVSFFTWRQDRRVVERVWMWARVTTAW